MISRGRAGRRSRTQARDMARRVTTHWNQLKYYVLKPMNIISPQIFLDIVVYIFISQWELKFENLPYLCINWNYTEEAYQQFTILDSISLCYFKSLELLNFVQTVNYIFWFLIFGSRFPGEAGGVLRIVLTVITAYFTLLLMSELVGVSKTINLSSYIQ